MRIKKINRQFRPSKKYNLIITEKAKIYLRENEQITLVDDYKNEYSNTTIIQSTHPYISDKSVTAGEQIVRFVSKLNKDDLLIALVSGGGSAMMALPIDDVSICEKVQCISAILTAGIPEREANEIKKALSKIKGGGLSAASGSTRIINLILSDERNHKLDAIASGPTVQPKKNQAIKIIEEYDISSILPKKVLKSIYSKENMSEEESAKKIDNFLIGSREVLIEYIKENASHFSFDSIHILDNLAEIETEYAAKYLAEKYWEIYRKSAHGNHLIIATGELQVPVKDITSSKGGRNQHLCALMMNQVDFDFDFSFIAYATDGVDFIEGCAGAFFTNYHLSMIKGLEVQIMKYVSERKTYYLHKQLDTLIKSRITGHNVSDFYLFSFNKI